ncbi:unnamed protein product [Cercospora beticola]|nr:unnamed protein product [Cercospora beticola]
MVTPKSPNAKLAVPGPEEANFMNEKGNDRMLPRRRGGEQGGVLRQTGRLNSSRGAGQAQDTRRAGVALHVPSSSSRAGCSSAVRSAGGPVSAQTQTYQSARETSARPPPRPCGHLLVEPHLYIWPLLPSAYMISIAVQWYGFFGGSPNRSGLLVLDASHFA